MLECRPAPACAAWCARHRSRSGPLRQCRSKWPQRLVRTAPLKPPLFCSGCIEGKPQLRKAVEPDRNEIPRVGAMHPGVAACRHELAGLDLLAALDEVVDERRNGAKRIAGGQSSLATHDHPAVDRQLN